MGTDSRAEFVIDFNGDDRAGRTQIASANIVARGTSMRWSCLGRIRRGQSCPNPKLIWQTSVPHRA
jgi:hypothetical protein